MTVQRQITSYKEFVFLIFSQYSAQLATIILSSLVAISTGFFNKITSSFLNNMSNTNSNANVAYLDKISSNQKVWNELFGDGINKISISNASSNWINFYISFVSLYNFLGSFNPVGLLPAGNAEALAWYTSNIASMKNMLLLLSSSSMSSAGFFLYDGSSYYLLLPDGIDYGWLVFNTATSYLTKPGGNNELILIVNKNSCRIIENIQVAYMINTIYSEKQMSNSYVLNFAKPLAISTDNPQVGPPELTSFSYFNQFLGLIMTVYATSDPNQVMVTFKDQNGKGISITKSKVVSFIS